MARPLDRGIATAIFVLAAVAVLAPVAVTRAPLPPPTRPVTDPEALADLVAIVRRGDAASWRVEFSFVRRLLGGDEITGAIVEVNQPPARLVAAMGTLTARVSTRTFTCTETEVGPQCLEGGESGPSETGDLGASLEIISRIGRYAITRVASPPILGEPTECFRVESIGARPLASFGVASEHCFAPDGVPLRTRVERPGATDERTAVQVSRRVSARKVRALLKRFGLRPEAIEG